MPPAADPLHLPPRARVTPQRRAVLETLEEWEGSFTVVELYDRARRAYPALALATTYRTVDLLRRAGSVRPLPGTGRPTYVRCHSGHHHHLICLTCGSVEETEICAAPATRAAPASTNAASVSRSTRGARVVASTRVLTAEA